MHNISFCGMSHPTLPEDVVHNTPLLYYRFHGEGALYASDYREEELQKMADKLKVLKGVDQGYLFFNNDIHGYAIRNVQKLKTLL